MRKVRRGYYILRLVSAFYKICAIVSLLFAVLTACALLANFGQISAFYAQYGLSSVPAVFLAGVVIMLVLAGLPALHFWIIASLLDLLVNVNFKVEVLTAYVLQGKDPSPEKVDEAEAYIERMKAKYQ